MHDNRSHPLLEQVPLTVSPFVHLPRATTLPYLYKTMPSALPPSIVEGPGPVTPLSAGTGTPPQLPPSASASSAAATGTSTPAKPAYVVSPASASAAHPDDILASCRVLREHLARMQADADAEIQQFEARIQARELAEKRRVAPGWLDSDERLLVPERRSTPGDSSSGGAGGDGGNGSDGSTSMQPTEMAAPVPDTVAAAGGVTAEALDQAFGSMKLNRP